MKRRLCPVILVGGVGSRLWPLSRQNSPKPFLPWPGSHHSLFQQTLQRLDGLQTINPIIVSNENNRFLLQDQIDQIETQASCIINEPIGRNTAPALTLAALWIVEHLEDAMMLMLPSDHVIQDVAAFHSAIHEAVELATAGNLVTFGVVPNEPNTGYGYIHKGKGYEVLEFVEKPDAKTAKEYLTSRDYLWNSGMFVIGASHWIEEIKTHCPDILTACQDAFRQGHQDDELFFVNKEAFSSCSSDSVDYAVAEKSEKVAVVPLDAKWSDVGDWASFKEIRDQEKDNNVTQGDVICHDTKGSLLMSNHRLLTAVGLKDTVVIETADAVLVAAKSKSQRVKQIVEELQLNHRNECVDHVKVSNKPWGSYQVLDKSDGFQVKRISVKPGAALSLQAHNHRAEHWVVVKGTAKVTRDKDVLTLRENESVYIPLQATHRLENPGNDMLELIEVQLGSYLGEDDIIRFEDVYHRA